MEGVGQVCVRGNRFTEKFTITIDGEPMNRVYKKQYSLLRNGVNISFSLNGNVLKGLSIPYGRYTYILTTPVPWYSYVFASLVFIMTLTVGNISYFPEHGFYFVGGAIGGFIGGFCSMLSLYLSAMVSKWWQRILIGLGALLLTFGLCFGIGNLIVMLFRK